MGIEVSNLSKMLGKTQALEQVSLSFRPGMMHGVIGPEGAGKTTLIRHLVGLLKPNTGDVAYTSNGKSIDFKEVRDLVAYMPQQQSLYPDLSIAEHLDFFKELYAVSDQSYEQKRRELLRITRLEDFLDRPAGKLSGGMYKKLGLMCALLRSPKAVLLDEPTNGVDPISRREFWELLYELLHQKILIIVTTAYMDEAERCSQVHLLDKGKILETGDPREILSREGVRDFNSFFVKRALA